MFPRPEWAGDPPAVALPIVSCQAEVRRPLLVGDQLLISLRPEVLGTEGLEVSDSFDREGQPVAQDLTRHLAIDAAERHRCPLPEGIRRWLEASGLTNWVRPISCGVPPLSTAAVNQDGRHASWPRWIKQLFRSLSGDPSQFTPEEKH